MAKQGRAEPEQAGQSGAELSLARSVWVEPIAMPSRAGPSRAVPSRAGPGWTKMARMWPQNWSSRPILGPL